MKNNSKEILLAADYCSHDNAKNLQELLEKSPFNPNELLLTFKYKVSRTNVPLLCVCVTSNSVDCARLLINAGANIEISKRGFVECVRLLLQAGVSVNYTDASGRSSLHFACWHGHTGLIPLLLEYKANVDLKDFEKNTPLHYACWNGNLEICKALLKAGAKIDMQDQSGRTPLYYSVQHKHPDIVQFLLENHSDPTIQTCTGATPESLATQENIDSIIEIFQKYNKEIHEKKQNSDNSNDINSSSTSDSSENLGKDFTDEHNRMKIVINKLIETANDELDMLQKLHSNLDEQNSAIFTFESNINDTMNQLREIEYTLNGIASTINTISGASNPSSGKINSTSTFDIPKQTIPQMSQSVNGTALSPGYSPYLTFTALDNTSGSVMSSSNANVGNSHLLITKISPQTYNMDHPKMYYANPNFNDQNSYSKMCRLCGVNPATVRCKNCRSPYCNSCIPKVRANGCKFCKEITASKAAKAAKVAKTEKS